MGTVNLVECTFDSRGRATALADVLDLGTERQDDAVRQMRSAKTWDRPRKTIRTCAVIWRSGVKDPAYAPGQAATAHGEIDGR